MSEQPSPDNQVERIFRRITEAGQHIRFGVGVVSKTALVAVVVVAAWVYILSRLNGNWTLDAILIGCGLIMTVYAHVWTRETHKFAHENPAQAMLEGTQIIEYKKLEAESKLGLTSVAVGLGSEEGIPLIGGE